VILTDGSISSPKILKEISECPECSIEALRVVSIMPKWNPGIANGQTVNKTVTFPITIKTYDGEPMEVPIKGD